MSAIEKGILQQKAFSIEWKIERFFADCEKVGDSYESLIFSIRCGNEDTEWYLWIFPKGIDETNENSTEVFLCYQNQNVSEVKVDWQISTVTEKGTTYIPEKMSNTFMGPYEHWGCTLGFLKRDDKKDSVEDILVDDTLTILCEIEILESVQNVGVDFHGYDECLDKIANHSEKYEQFLEKDYFSDVTFNIQEEKMYLHKAIVASGSPVFQAMFEHDMKEKKQGSVDITDVDYEIMKELFRFIYSGKVENIEKIAKDLLIAADKYSIVELKALCEKTLYNNLTVDNAIECLKLTDTCDTLHLKTLVITFMVDHYKDIVAKSEFEDLDSSIMCQIFRAVAVKK